MNLTREEINAPHPNGGGIAIGIASGIVFRNLTTKLPEALRSYEILFVQATHETFEAYLLNIYLSNFQQQKKILKRVNEFVRDLMSNKPKALVIVSGDFNSSKTPIQHMRILSPDGPTFRRIGEVRALESNTDWVFGANLELLSSRAEWRDGLSDHALIACELSYQSHRPTASHFKIPCPIRCLGMC